MKEEDALGLLPYLDEDNAQQLEELIDSGASFEKITNFITNVLEPGEIANIIDELVVVEEKEEVCPVIKYLDKNRYPRYIRKELEYFEYIDTLSEEDAEYVKQFYHEFYGKGFYSIPEDERILTTEEMLREARRNNNSLTRDAYNATHNQGLLHYLEDNSVTDNQDDPINWDIVYNKGGYAAAVEFIVERTVDALDNLEVDRRIVLVQFYIRMERLRKQNNRDKKVRK